MKKLLSVFLACVLAIGTLSACGSSSIKSDNDDGKLQIVTTIFPAYDWAKNVLGDTTTAEVSMLIDDGIDLHSYQPTPEDILQISSCDLFIYVGGESDEWVEDALKEAINENMIVINLSDVLGESLKEEELVEGMEGEEDEEGEEEEAEYDEHVWLSLKNAATLTEAISEGIQTMDPDNASTYEANTTSYLEELSSLDDKYKEAVANGNVSTILVGDRFPFRYLVDDYDLDYYAAFVGCSAETEASFETITFLAEKMDELDLNYILVIDGSDKELATTIVENTTNKDQEILVLNSMQSVSADDVANGTTYLSIMEENLDVLSTVLKN